ncbi:MAG: hypothetical protein J1G01_00140 [Clostridiales bacterium]|nr:hypothetical protein [Clostridiales bacterium]
MGALPDNSESRRELEEQIKQLEKADSHATRESLPSTKLDELSYTAPSDEYLEAQAEKSLQGYKSSGEKSIRENSENEAKARARQREAYLKGRDGDIAALGDSYRAAALAIDNDAMKRGLARSSIAAAGKSELESEYLKRNADIVDTYGKKIAELDSEIAAADSKLRAALDDFNLTYATKLNEKIESLKSERDKKVEEVTKYNNEVRAKQAALDQSRLKTESDLYSAALSQEQKENSLDGISPEKRDEIYRSVYDKMDEYLSSMTPQQAKLEIRNHTMYRKHLSNYYYYKLYDKYGR